MLCREYEVDIEAEHKVVGRRRSIIILYTYRHTENCNRQLTIVIHIQSQIQPFQLVGMGVAQARPNYEKTVLYLYRSFCAYFTLTSTNHLYAHIG